MQNTFTVNWRRYAQTYDILLEYNPFYQQLFKEVIAEVKQWDIKKDDFIADIGAGTGNYSIKMAQLFPQAEIFHIDNDGGMNAVTRDKIEKTPLRNHHFLEKDIEDVYMASNSLRAIISIHALYIFQDPKMVLTYMFNWLEFGGYAIFVDPGRVANMLNWQLAIGQHLIRKYGLRKTMEIMKQAREINDQNAYIRERQLRGELWTHSHQEFCEAVNEAGFTIISSKKTFRGISDLVIARKI
ncbi:MAG: methyltransferase domain-containing protein [Bacteroidota bacterium]